MFKIWKFISLTFILGLSLVGCSNAVLKTSVSSILTAPIVQPTPNSLPTVLTLTLSDGTIQTVQGSPYQQSGEEFAFIGTGQLTTVSADLTSGFVTSYVVVNGQINVAPYCQINSFSLSLPASVVTSGNNVNIYVTDGC